VGCAPGPGAPLPGRGAYRGRQGLRKHTPSSPRALWTTPSATIPQHANHPGIPLCHPRLPQPPPLPHTHSHSVGRRTRSPPPTDRPQRLGRTETQPAHPPPPSRDLPRLPDARSRPSRPRHPSRRGRTRHGRQPRPGPRRAMSPAKDRRGARTRTRTSSRRGWGGARTRTRTSSRRGWGGTAVRRSRGVGGGCVRARGQVSRPLPRTVGVVGWVGRTGHATSRRGGTGAGGRSPNKQRSGSSRERPLLRELDGLRERLRRRPGASSSGARRGSPGFPRRRPAAGSPTTPAGTDALGRCASTLAPSAEPGTSLARAVGSRSDGTTRPGPDAGQRSADSRDETSPGC
jgi:hypothetical protein